MRARRGWRSLAAILAYVQVAFNLLLYAVHPVWSTIVLALVWLVTGGFFTGSALIHQRRERGRAVRFEAPLQPRVSDPVISAVALNYSNAARQHVPVRHGDLRRSFTLDAGEQVLPVGWKRVESARGTQYVQECSHWPRDEVKLSDGSVAAYICRRCGHDWANEDWVRSH